MHYFKSQIFDQEYHNNYSLKNNLIAIKAEFENDGTSIYELAILSEFCKKNKLPLTLKIGGPLAKNDIYDAFHIGAQNIIAPMIESKISLKKFFDLYSKVLDVFESNYIKPSIMINIESYLAFKKLDEILEFINQSNSKLARIIIGRKDLSKSINENNVNSQRIYKITLEILKKATKQNIHVTVGGNISHKSYKFISSLSQNGLTSFETRKCTFLIDKNISKEKFNKFVQFGLIFELEWLKHKKEIYNYQSKKDDNRIDSLIDRI